MSRAGRLLIGWGIVLTISTAAGQDFVPGKILVKFKPGTNGSARAVARLGGRIAGRLAEQSVDCIQLPAGASVSGAVTKLQADPSVEFAEPDYVERILGDDDPLFIRQWALQRISAPEAWAITKGSPTVLVAVLDTGADFTHQDLVGQIVDSHNFVGSGPATDGNGHGTHTAGTVAAKTDNGIGVASLGYNTRLLIGKVVDNTGQGDALTVAEGIDWA